MQGCARSIKTCAAVLSVVLLASCATRSTDVQPRPSDPAPYVAWDCERLFDEIDTVQQRAADVAYAVDARVGNNLIALGVGVTVFWPALLAMRPDGPEAAQLAGLKGRFEAMRSVAARRHCGDAPPGMAAQRAAALPVTLGERLVYDERTGTTSEAHELGLRVTALRRDQIEFSADLDGVVLAAPWRQDLAGNPALAGRPALIAWQHLLHRKLELGQVLSGELAAANESVALGRLRGQVVATGPQTVAGRNFDVAVIELFGDAPGGADGRPASERLDGVMAVDRRSGVLLRLELRSANGDYALRRRLLRVERAAP